MTRKEELEKIIGKANKELAKIYKDEIKELQKQFKTQYLKYHNSYGCGEKWWLYAKTLEMDENGSIKSFQFQKDCDGKISIETDPLFAGVNMYTEITKEEYEHEWENLKAEINKY